MSTQEQSTSAAERNVALIREHLAASNETMNDAGNMGDLDLDLYSTYDENTVFYCLGREYHGPEGIREFLRPIEGYKQILNDVIDIFGSDDRVCLVINEQVERVSDGQRFDFVRNVIYKLRRTKITECWIADRPYTWGLQEYHDAALGRG